ncbi:hypothetical protein SAMN05192558_11450 [Actinokineospora alba]|uniref:Uncharacterized protein n=1 Tax=Actinokineospora alba TaxID=504798 RepID=A0A1H0VI99_9PSEU|nr:hypothetical protein [Actinokineospora alba]TDP67709.1 hypothetical protein C8E96_3259 [Actinokineospora alba]SDJ27772.1 hypothetical protein SAMN05421871_11250 [Actinokineospora alba]SDP78074.1 hypothetical protein SAMN05192558_11450 [Actinokineospora alba]
MRYLSRPRGRAHLSPDPRTETAASSVPVRARRFGVLLSLVAMVSGGLLMGAGVSSAAETVVLESCSARVVGAPGQPIALRPSAVEPPILAALAPLDPLGVTRILFKQVWSTLPPIPIGAVPDTGQAMINGDVIANAVTTQLLGLPVLSPVIGTLLPTVWSTIAQTCGVVGEVAGTAIGANPGTPPPTNPAPGSPGSAPTTTVRPAPGKPGAPGTPGAPPSYHESGPAVPPGAAPERPAGSPGGSNQALEYPVEWKTRAPGLGLPPEAVAVLTAPAGNSPVPQFGLAGQGDTAADNRTTGSAVPLPAAARGLSYGPIVLAALLIALVAAQTARTIALRRSAPAGASRLGLQWRQLRIPVPVVKR